MNLPKYKDLHRFSTSMEIEQEILRLQKVLFDLKLKKRSALAGKPHLFVHTKRQIAQLMLKRSLQSKN